MTPEKVQPTYTVAQGEPVPQVNKLAPATLPVLPPPSILETIWQCVKQTRAAGSRPLTIWCYKTLELQGTRESEQPRGGIVWGCSGQCFLPIICVWDELRNHWIWTADFTSDFIQRKKYELINKIQSWCSSHWYEVFLPSFLIESPPYLFIFKSILDL